jgi:flagellar biosynthesis protein FlhB
MRVAAGAGVCMVEDADLARALYRRCPLRAAVPRKYVDRVAEIVAYARQVRSHAGPGGRKGDVGQAVRV